MNESCQILGEPKAGGILIVGDHAANHVPPDIDLGIDESELHRHIAYDIGVADVSTLMVAAGSVNAAILGACSRLVVDLNRDADALAAIPIESDGTIIPGNHLNDEQRAERMARFFHPYHNILAALLCEHRPKLILSLHSFTPLLKDRPDEVRPWDIGVLYNEDAMTSHIAIEFLKEKSLNVGDQLPYSGKLLNATMNRHAEANAIPYIGIEMRQDHVGTQAGCKRFADILGEMANHVIERLA